jgi:hypothetical protein
VADQARDVEFNYTAKDKTGPAADSVTKKMKETGDKSAKALDGAFTKGLIGAVSKVSPKIAGDMTSLFTAVGGKGGVALAAGLTLAAPLIGSVVSAAVIGGVGIGGIAGGVALAARSPQVQAAGRALGQTLATSMEADADVFVVPTLDAIGQIEHRARALRPTFRSIFQNSAEFVGPFTDRVLDGVEGITRGVDSMLSDAGPVMDEMGDLFAELGDSAGRALAIIGGGSEEAASGLNFLTEVTASSITSVGVSLRGLSEAWGAATRPFEQFREGVLILRDGGRNLSQWVDPAVDHVTELATASYKLALHTQGVSGPIYTLSERMNGLSKASNDAFTATTNVGAALDEARDALQKNGRTLDENTEKGRANRTVLQNLARTMIAQYDATVAVNGEGEKSASIANTNRARFIELASSMTGSRKKAEELADTLGVLGDKRVKPEVSISDAKARSQIAAVQRALNNLKDKHVRIFVSRRGEVTYGGGGGRQASMFNAGQYFTTAGRGDGTHRTEAPRPVQVSSDVSVYLDGEPFYARTHTAVRASESRQAWRQNVGRR